MAGFRTALSRAIWAGYQRSVQLGGGKERSQLADGEQLSREQTKSPAYQKQGGALMRLALANEEGVRLWFQT